MNENNKHGGTGRNQGRHNKWDPLFEYLVFYECERLVRETLLRIIEKQKDKHFIWETDLNNYWQYISTVPIHRRTEFLENEAKEIYFEQFQYDIDILSPNDECAGQSTAVINLNAYLPWGAKSKIKEEVAKKYSITPSQVGYIWKKTKPI